MVEEVQQKIKDEKAKAVTLPAFKDKYGTVNLAAWENKIQKGKQEFTRFPFKLTKSYCDSEKKWHSSDYFEFRDIADIELALNAFKQWFRKDKNVDVKEVG